MLTATFALGIVRTSGMTNHHTDSSRSDAWADLRSADARIAQRLRQTFHRLKRGSLTMLLVDEAREVRGMESVRKAYLGL